MNKHHIPRRSGSADYHRTRVQRGQHAAATHMGFMTRSIDGTKDNASYLFFEDTLGSASTFVMSAPMHEKTVLIFPIP